jgi:signal transduction histidine kinase
MIKVILEKQDLSINRLNILISDLLDITRLNAGKMQFNKAFVDFDAIINESVDSSRPLSETHRIIVHGKANAQIYADRQRLNQVLTNLIANAIKYSPQADSVVVRVKKTGNLVKVAVVDHGIGIPAAEQLKVFQQFYRCQKTAKHYPGLGIGLYISREIIRKHKGEIWFESQENKGSVFYFKIPIRRSSHGKNSNL